LTNKNAVLVFGDAKPIPPSSAEPAAALEVCESPQTSLARLALIALVMALSLGATETTETQKAISDIVTLQG
jgi:hypothetical protein